MKSYKIIKDEQGKPTGLNINADPSKADNEVDKAFAQMFSNFM